MKTIRYGLMLALGITATANAEFITKKLSQENKHFHLIMEKGDIVSVTFDLRRYPIYRQHQWYSYVLLCDTSEISKISYPLKGQIKNASGEIMVSVADGQLVCSQLEDKWCVNSEIDERGIFTIENISAKQASADCTLYNKVGL